MKRVAKTIAGILLLVIIGLCFWGWMENEPRPQVNVSNEADELAKQMLLAVNDSAWQQTKAISWNFRGARKHIWDKDRNYHLATWGDYVVWMDLATQKGIAEKEGVRLTGEDLEEALALSWKRWCNDAFWLNPITKIFDEGTTRSIVTVAGQKGLMVSYSSGGVTPGDAYVWLLDEQNRPIAWKLWVSLIPIGGIQTSWDGWQQLPTGAWVSTQHDVGPLSLLLTDIKADTSLTAITRGEDPFIVLEQ